MERSELRASRRVGIHRRGSGWVGIGIVRLAASGLLVFTLHTVARGETILVEVEHSLDDLLISTRDGFVDVRLPDAPQLDRIGAPALPVRVEEVLLPEGTAAVAATGTSLASVRLPVGRIRPVQRPAILGPAGASIGPPARVPPDPAIYHGDALYPDTLVRFRGGGRVAGVEVVAIEVHPVQFDPRTAEIVLHTRIAVELTVAPVAARRARPAAGTEAARLASTFARGLTRGAPARAPRMTAGGTALDLDPGAYAYVIVTNEAQRAPYERYAAWKTAKGIPATVVTVESIDADYPGADLPERIRNLLIAAADTWGTTYVLLGGDHDVVPSRLAFAFDCEAGYYPDENDIPADLYYSDLDGTWDANGNGVFGEVDDEVDLYPDVIVGRAPTVYAGQAEGVVDKFLTYEQAPPVGYAMDALFFAEILWSDPYTDSGIGKDMIAERHLQAYEPIERQYEAMGNESVATVLSALGRGPHLVNHSGHASSAVLGCGTGNLRREEVDRLRNAPRYFVLFSIGCLAGAFDRDAIGERFLTNPDGGAIAFVGNSRYGWGSPGNPGWGYSETFDSDFYGALLDGFDQFGVALARAKILRVPFARDANVYRWHEYEVNLLGDPEMNFHAAEVAALSLDAPATIPSGRTSFCASVGDANGPIEGARVCLMGEGVYQVGFTDGAGWVHFTPSTPAPGALTLTATAAGHSFAQRVITAADLEPYLTVVSTRVDDGPSAPSSGDGDGAVEAGETIALAVAVRNVGGAACAGVVATLSSMSPCATIVSGEAAFGDLGAGATASNATPFTVALSRDCAAREPVTVLLAVEDDAGRRWTEAIGLDVVAPGLRVHHCDVMESAGDGDGAAEPGEIVLVTVHVVNEGDATAGRTDAELLTVDANVRITRGAATSETRLRPGEVRALDPPFRVRIADDAPATAYARLSIDMRCDGARQEDELLLAIGEPGFRDGMERGEGVWSHSGAADLWRLSDDRRHSGEYSWYCGDADHRYVDGMDAVLASPEFVVPERAELSFWAYFDLTIYGTDGLFVEVRDGDAWTTLDYIGSGGALDSTLIVGGWAERGYDLRDLEPGSVSQLRFRFVSDGADVDEGFYLDDVSVHAARSPEIERFVSGLRFVVSPASAVPARGIARWRVTLPEAGSVVVRIHDVRGRLVRALDVGMLAAGVHDVDWDGFTRDGSAAPGGVYFARFRAGKDETARRVVWLGR